MEDYNELIEAYKEIYYSKNNDFNILTSVHLRENDHTNILCEILNMTIDGKKLFMKSFVEMVLKLPELSNNNFIALTQISAMGSKEDSKGFIDLLIKDDKNHYIVIENKVCDASDMPHQLDRYYFTLVQNKELLSHYDEEFREDCEQFWENRQDQHKEVYIVYLTKDGKKKPSEDSINNELKKQLEAAEKKRYIEINYKKHIREWQENVLDQIKDQLPIAEKSVELYLLELDNILQTEKDYVAAYRDDKQIRNVLREKLFIKPEPSLNDQYDQYSNAFKEIQKRYKKLEQTKEYDKALGDLKNCLECYRDNVFGHYALEGWTIHRAPKWITFYPTRWMDKYGGNDNCNIHFGINWEKKNTKFDFAIQNKAGKIYSQSLRADEKFDVIHNIQKDEMWRFCKGTDLSIKLDLKKMHLSWDIGNDETTKKFFEDFAKNDTIKKLIDWIDKNLK